MRGLALDTDEACAAPELHPRRAEPMSPTPKLLILVGAFLLVVGLLFHLGTRFGLGRLPGDITWRGRDVTVYLPLATSLLLSVLLTLLAAFLLRPSR